MTNDRVLGDRSQLTITSLVYRSMLHDRKQWGVMALGAGVTNFVSLEKNTKSILHFVKSGNADGEASQQPTISSTRISESEPSACDNVLEDLQAVESKEEPPEVDTISTAASKGLDRTSTRLNSS